MTGPDALRRRWRPRDTVAEHLPLALARLHRSLTPGDEATLELPAAHLGAERVRDLVIGAGFVPCAPPARRGGRWWVDVTRARSLPDTVGVAMVLLVCGLNPSVVAADAGVGYVRPGNRFWPAALASGLVTRDRDPDHALEAHGVGMTDLVKRATPRADGLRSDEYAAGIARVERLAAWLRPGAICFVGLAGWRAAVDRRALAGPQQRRLGDVPVHLMPSTSGANAHADLVELTAHLGVAAELGRRRLAG